MMTVMLMLTFLLSAFSTTPAATASIRAALAWVALVTDPLQVAAGRWMAFRLTDAQFGMFVAALAALCVVPSLVYTWVTAPLGLFVPVKSFCVWMTEAVLITYTVVEACHLKAYAREKRWERAARLVDG